MDPLGRERGRGSASKELASLHMPIIALYNDSAHSHVGQVGNLRADCQSAQTERVSNPLQDDILPHIRICKNLDMSRRLHKPAFPLSQYVEFFWRATSSGSPPSRQRVFPNGAMALVIHLRKPTMTFFVDDEPQTIRVPLLAGPYSRSFDMDPSESTEVIGVLFRPGAARIFFPVEAHELQNIDIALSELHPGEADRLLNDLCCTAGEPEQFRAMEQYLSRN